MHDAKNYDIVVPVDCDFGTLVTLLKTLFGVNDKLYDCLVRHHGHRVQNVEQIKGKTPLSFREKLRKLDIASSTEEQLALYSMPDLHCDALENNLGVGKKPSKKELLAAILKESTTSSSSSEIMIQIKKIDGQLEQLAVRPGFVLDISHYMVNPETEDKQEIDANQKQPVEFEIDFVEEGESDSEPEIKEEVDA